MSLGFPNTSRSFEPDKNRVQFWGYDNIKEISFFVEAAVLMKLCPDANNTEAELLQAFDAMQNHIYEMAGRVYLRSKGKSCSYTLTTKET